MGKIRVYELAKELGVENRIVIEKAKELNIPGKTSHSHSLDSDEADRIRRTMLRDAMATKSEGAGVQVSTEIDVKTGTTVTVRRSGNIIRRRRSDDSTSDEVEAAGVAVDPAESESDRTTDIEQPQLEADVAESGELAASAAVEEMGEGVEAHASSTPEAEEEVEVEAAVPSTEATGDTEDQTGEVVEDKKPSGGPRVLGKIELPRKRVVSENRTARSREVAPGVVGVVEDSPRGRGKREKRGRKKEFSRGDLVDYDGNSPKRGGRRKGQDRREDQHRVVAAPATQMRAEKRVVKIDEVITVGEFARAMSLKAGEVVQKLMGLGVLATINQAIDFDTASIVADEFGFTTESVAFDEESMLTVKGADDVENLQPRAPIVTVMGHVDHGKTSLLDAIRQSSVAAKEHGGITQHIGAYKVDLDANRSIAFIDTPGHAAFTAMRARGAQVTDIVILVVAADDGVMPQTLEAINHAKAANVPIIVAVNKVDKPGANIDKVKTQLAEHELTPEDWGGETMYFPVSALKRQGIQELLEGILLQAEVGELKANPDKRAVGVIIESRQDRGRGIVATVLVQSGTLRIGDPFVSGAESGRVRSMLDYSGNKVEVAPPSTPVEITGLTGIPDAGDDFYVAESDIEARQIASQRGLRQQRKDQLAAVGTPMTLEQFSMMANQKEQRSLSVIIKADVQGSAEAVKQSVEKLSGDKVKVNVIHAGVGGITESDVKLAMASKAIVFGFSVRAEPRAQRDAESIGVEIRFYTVIYELLDDVKKAMEGLLDPIKTEENIGRVEVRDTFVIPKLGTVAGCFVVDGSVRRNAFVRLVRDSKVIHEGKMVSLRRFKDDVREVQSGYECGIGIERYNDIKVGDVMEIFEIKESRQTLD